MDEFTLRDYLKVLFRQKWVIITCIITITVVVAINLMLKTKTYEASVKLLVSAQKQVESPYYREIGQPSEVALTQSEIVKSNPVMERTMKAIGLKPLDYERKFASPLKRKLIDWRVAAINRKFEEGGYTEQQKEVTLYLSQLGELRANTKVEPISGTNLFAITYWDFDPNVAAAIANIISRSYVIFDLEQQLAELQMKYGEKNLAVTQLKDNIAKMEQNLNGKTLPNIEAIGPATVKIIEQAMPGGIVGPSKFKTLLLAVILSIFLGILLAFGLDYLDQTFKSPREIENILGIPFLGTIPKEPKPADYERISDQLCFELKDRKLKSLMIVAAYPKEGVTTAVVNLAKSISNKCRPKVLIIDANLRKPAIHYAFKIANKEGLVDVIEGRVSFEEAVNKITDNLFVLTSGKVDISPGPLLESQKMGVLIEHAKEKYDVVFVDCTNLKEAKDAVVLSLHLDSIVFIVEEGRTRRQTAKKAVETIAKSKTVFLGAILGSRKFVLPKAIYERV